MYTITYMVMLKMLYAAPTKLSRIILVRSMHYLYFYL